MEHRINVWIQRLVVPCAAIPTVELRHFGFALLKTLAIILPIFGVAMILLIAVAPDPRAEEFVWGKKIACASLGNVVGEMAICC